MSLRQPWSEKEDQILESLVRKYGTSNWILISQKMETRASTNPRSGKQCRQRWHNHLDPGVTKKSWTLQEERVMFEGHRRFGNRWAEIANELQNRQRREEPFLCGDKEVFEEDYTERIKNIKPSTLSRLLQSKDKRSKQTSEALFKFILSRENLKVDSIQKKTKAILEQLIGQIQEQNFQNDSKEQMEENEKKKRPQNKTHRKSKLSQQLITSGGLQQSGETKKVVRSRSSKRKPIREGSLNANEQKSTRRLEEQKMEQQFEVVMEKNLSNKQEVIDSVSPGLGFQWVEELGGKRESVMEKRSSIRQEFGEEKGMMNQFSLWEDLSPGMRRRSSTRGLILNNDYRTIYVTPRNPTPGTVQSLFPGWGQSIRLTGQQIEDERQRIRRQIQSNNVQK